MNKKLPLYLIFTCLILTTLVFLGASRHQKGLIENEVESRATFLEHLLLSTLKANEEILLSMEGLFASSELVTREEFNTFLTLTLERHPYIQALEWIPKVSLKQKRSFEKEMSSLGHGKFFFYEKSIEGEIVPVEDRPFYFPVYYVEPFFENIKAFGFDLASNEKRRLTIEKAIATKTFQATPKINLVQDRTSQAGMLLIHPYFDKAGINTGVTLGVYKVTDMLNMLLRESIISKHVSLMIYDGDSTSAVDLIYQANLAEGNGNTALIRSVDVSSRTWTLVWSPTHTLITDLAALSPTLWAAIALIICALISTLINLTFNQRLKITKEVDLRTKIAEEAATSANTSNKAKSDFLASMSHEIRTPMNGIIGMIDILKETSLTKDQQVYINSIDHSGIALMEIIHDILDFSKIEANKIELEDHVINLHEFVNNLSLPFVSIILEKGLSFNINSEDNLPDCISCDRTRLRQIISNLISNSVKFTEHGGIELFVRNGPSQNTLEFEIIDTGIGIREENLEKLFIPFSQADNSITRRFGGSGLGLTISKTLCELMGGDLSVKSTYEEGSSFKFFIHYRQVSIEKVNEINMSDKALPVPDKINLKVLVAEDNSINQKVISLMLKSLGVEYTLVDNGLQALEQTKLNSFDLILMDIQMPVMDGITATEKIISSLKEKSPPIIAITANVFKEDRKRCLDAGMSYVLSKPVRKKELLDVLASFRHH
ncbi:hypothetical protein A9Q84_17105 [Halobacteriovorax marinus]|uniref:Sensory/regulatory protein RpfC n=1 Tax=Halobacteriovorax marinus TaxID=97084 RepID=A0A1Y5F7I1_9BACT|nr:hypothetical protein A9Q84_17105 [Halobacteriovorax marinus]